MQKMVIEIDGKSLVGDVEVIDGTLWARIGGRTLTYIPPVKETRRGSRAGAGASGTDVIAPMPGKIIKLAVEVGATVTAQQVAVVMEAMKMEYTLKFAASGKVAGLFCKPGDQVALGQTLVKIKVESVEQEKFP